MVIDVNSTKSTCAHTQMDTIKPTYDTAISCCNTAKNGIFCFTYLNVHLWSYFHLNISFILKCNLISKQSSVQARFHILLGYFIEKMNSAGFIGPACPMQFHYIIYWFHQLHVVSLHSVTHRGFSDIQTELTNLPILPNFWLIGLLA